MLPEELKGRSLVLQAIWQSFAPLRHNLLLQLSKRRSDWRAERLVATNKLGQLLVLDGQNEAGLAVLQKCTQQAEEAFPKGSSLETDLLPFYLASLADALRRCGQLMEARETLHRALGLRSVWFGPPPWRQLQKPGE